MAIIQLPPRPHTSVQLSRLQQIIQAQPIHQRHVSVQLDDSPTGLLRPSDNPVDISTSIIQEINLDGGLYFANLLDVIAESPHDGDTIVFDSDQDKYVVQPMEFLGEIDCGEF